MPLWLPNHNLFDCEQVPVIVGNLIWNDFVLELEALNYVIAFCTETWREEREEHCLTPSGHHIYLSGGDGHRGVGICIPKFFHELGVCTLISTMYNVLPLSVTCQPIGIRTGQLRKFLVVEHAHP